MDKLLHSISPQHEFSKLTFCEGQDMGLHSSCTWFCRERHNPQAKIIQKQHSCTLSSEQGRIRDDYHPTFALVLEAKSWNLEIFLKMGPPKELKG